MPLGGVAYFAAATGFESAFFSDLPVDSLFLLSPLPAESLLAGESLAEEESEEDDPSLEEDSPEEPEEDESLEAAFSRWRLRVP